MLADVKVKEYVAATKALGLINKMITVPLWRVIEDKSIGILDVNAKYTSMRDSLKVWSEDASAMLTGNTSLFNDTLINKDVVFEKLVEECDDDSMTVEVLQLLFKSFYLTMERMLADHLPQGVHDKPSATKIGETKSTPKSNVVSERDFAQLDRLLREKLNATTIALEGMILYANNKTRSWLDSKTAEEKSEILKIATKLTPAYKKLFNQRREAIRQHVAQTLKEKQDEIERKKLRAQQQKEKLVNAISVDGLWQTDNAVEAGLLCYPSVSRKIVALKQQINFRKFVLVQEASDKALFSFSKDKKQHSLEQLKQNLVRLISETQDVTESPAKRGRNQGGEEDPVIQNPELLVGKRVVHYFEEDGTRQGYNGLVTGLVPGTRTWFNISYDAEGENEIHTFELLDDYREGDLEILDA